jgi:hypothetical protein
MDLQMVGKACTTDADCYGTVCATPTSTTSTATGSSGSTSSTDNFCATPKANEAEIFMNCIVARLNTTGVVMMKNKVLGKGSERVSDSTLTSKMVGF